MKGLRHVIIIEQNTPTRSASGADVDNWATFLTVRAKIEPMTGREYVGSEQVTDATTHKFTVRYREGIKAKMRIRWGTRLFDIQVPINSNERDKQLFIMAVEYDR